MNYDDALLILAGIKTIPRPQDPNKEHFVDDFGHYIYNVHRMEDCNPPCTIHSHGEHPLAHEPLLWRNDRGIFEHICEHGVGHPCPDSLNNDSGIHGCCGCCAHRQSSSG
jgi:hypothetical protein